MGQSHEALPRTSIAEPVQLWPFWRNKSAGHNGACFIQ